MLKLLVMFPRGSVCHFFFGGGDSRPATFVVKLISVKMTFPATAIAPENVFFLRESSLPTTIFQRLC